MPYQIIEKAKKPGVVLHLHLIDSKSVFDPVWREVLWKILLHIGVHHKIINTIQKVYKKKKKNRTCSLHSWKINQLF